MCIFPSESIGDEWPAALRRSQHSPTVRERLVWRIPAGSFRCERFVKSSLASSIAGFISGGRSAFESSSRSARASSIVFVCTCSSQLAASSQNWVSQGVLSTHLSVLQLKDELELVAIFGFRDQLRGHPALSWVRLPCSGPHVIVVRHLEGSEDAIWLDSGREPQGGC